jgi:hypothetical protein
MEKRWKTMENTVNGGGWEEPSMVDLFKDV